MAVVLSSMTQAHVGMKDEAPLTPPVRRDTLPVPSLLPSLLRRSSISDRIEDYDDEAPLTPPMRQNLCIPDLLPTSPEFTSHHQSAKATDPDDDEISLDSVFLRTPVASPTTTLNNSMTLLSPITRHSRHNKYDKKMAQKLNESDISAMFESIGELNLADLDLDDQNIKAAGDVSKKEQNNHESCGTAGTLLMGDSEWHGDEESNIDDDQEEEVVDDNDDDAASFASCCSPRQSSRSVVSPHSDWLGDLMTSKDAKDPAYATHWIVSPDGSTQHLELDTRLLLDTCSSIGNLPLLPIDMERSASDSMVGSMCLSGVTTPTKPHRGKVSKFIGEHNPLNSLVGFSKIRLQKKAQRRLSMS